MLRGGGLIRGCLFFGIGLFVEYEKLVLKIKRGTVDDGGEHLQRSRARLVSSFSPTRLIGATRNFMPCSSPTANSPSGGGETGPEE